MQIVKQGQPIFAVVRVAEGPPGGDLPRGPDAGALDRFKSGPVNRVFRALFIKDRAFRVTGACIGCGKCARLCPVSDIAIQDGRPRWLGHCMHCMACINACPARAIEYGRASLGRPRYYLEDTERMTEPS